MHRVRGSGPSTTLIMATVAKRSKLRVRALASANRQTLPFAAILVEVDRGGEGAAAVRNRALERVETEYVAVLDDDDWLLPEHNEVLTGALEAAEEDVALAYGGCRVLTASGERSGSDVWPWLGAPWGPEARAALQRSNFIPATVVLRTAAVREAGGWGAGGKWSPAEDWALLLELLARGRNFVRAGGAETWIYDLVSAPGERADGRPVLRPG